MYSITNDGEAGRTVLHAKTDADLPFGEYRNEHVFVFWFTEDGKKMSRVDDMMDSAFMLDLQGKFAEMQHGRK